jgi:RHS repeat-associated protein
MKIRAFLQPFVLILSVSILFLASPAYAQTYNVVDLGGMLGTNSYAYGINNQGQVVGYWRDTNGSRAFLYSGGAVTDLGSLGGTNRYALSINNVGQIVGFAGASNGTRAFLYSNGAITNLGAMGGINSYAYGINDTAQIVGNLDTTNGARAYLYTGGAVTNLGTLGGTNSFAFGINNSNLVVGSSLNAVAATHAFLWKNGILTNLNALVGTNSGWILNDARGINNDGTIVGWGLTNGQEQAFMYATGQVSSIGLLAGATNSFAFGINSSNQVVGASTLSNSTSRAFAWLNGTLKDLNTLLPAGFNWDLREARGINDKGQIVGWGITNGQEHAFIMSPNSPPSVLLTNPLANAVLSAPATVMFSANATDTDGTIAKVEFFEGGTKLGESTTSPYQFIWTGVVSGSYALRATATDNSGATNASATVNITVAVAPSLNSQPQSQRVLTSSNVTFAVSASGETPLAYQWRLNGINISGATTNTYSIANVQTVHGGNYTVIVTNIAGALASTTALLTVAVDPRNIGKGDWIYFLSDATNRLGQSVSGVTNVASLMTYERSQGMQFIVVKCGDGTTIWSQFDASLVAQAHAAGLKIFGYGRVYGTNMAGEIAVATNALALGADGFVIDAEIEYESQNLTNNSLAAAQYCQGIRSAYPNVFLAYSPFVFISSHANFPYIAFGTNCDAVMPQCYWKNFGITASNMVSGLNTEWSSWQNGLTGANTNAIKPIAPVGQGWSVSSTNLTTGTEIADFITRLKSTSTPATSGGYKGVSFWRADLHSPEMWDRIATSSIGNPTGAPLISSQPQSQKITNGLSASISATATGVAPLSYQWMLNGISISGATLSGYSLTNIQTTDAGVYSVIISNASGITLSSDAILSLAGYALWTETFEAGVSNWTAVSGATPLTNSTAQNHTPGGMNSAKTASTLNRTYRNLGAELDGNTKLTFWMNDDTQTRAYSEVRAYTGGGYGGTTGIQQVLAIGRYNTAFGPANGTLTNETVDGTKYQGRVSSGASNGWFNLNAPGAPARSTNWHKFEIERLADGTTINFFVDGILGRSISNATAATWDSVSIGSIGSGATALDAWFDDIKPEIVGLAVISTQPISQTVNGGANVSFTVSASGNVTGYQWRFNGVNIPGATTTTLVQADVQSANAGDYSVLVMNGLGATVSSIATLTVLYPPTIVTQPSIQTGNAGGAVTFRVVVGGPAPYTYQWTKDGIALTNSAVILNADTDQLTLTNLTQGAEGYYGVTVSNPAGSVSSASAMLSVNSGVVFSDGFESGITYWSAVPGASPLTLSTSQANPVSGSKTAHETNSLNKMYHDLGTEVSGRSRATFWIYNATAFDATRSFGEVRAFAGSGLNNGSLQQVLAIGNYTVPFDANTGMFFNELVNPALYQARVYSGANSGWFNLNAPGAPGWSAGWHQFSIEKSAAGTSVHFFIDGKLGRTVNDVTAGSWDVVEIGSAGIGSGTNETAWFDDIKVETLTSVITTQPASATNVAGTTATFTVGATGSGLAYQWRKNGTAISGATLSAYSIPNVQTTNEASYSVLVKTAADREYSGLAQLSVVSTPVITVAPVSQAVGAGSNAFFNVNASGNALSYQWKRNNTNLVNGGPVSGSTSQTLSLTGVSQFDASVYTVLVSNLAGAVTSSVASLTVIDPPIITISPRSQRVAIGSSVTFLVTATGTTPFSYQWMKYGAAISGATNSSLVLTAITTNSADYYSVSVANAAGSSTSSLAGLSVISAPSICTQPTNQTVNAGETVHFRVGVCQPTVVLPTVTSGTLAVWLKADQGVTTDTNGLVSVWRDQSGNANDVFQSITSCKPLWTNGVVPQSGKPAIEFDGVQDGVTGDFLLGTNHIGITNAYTSFIVYSRADHNDLTEKVPAMIGAPMDSNNTRGYYLSGNEMSFSAWENDYHTGFNLPNDSYRIWSIRMNTNKTVLDSYDNDGATHRHYSTTTAGIGMPSSLYFVGGLGSAARNFRGDIAEVIEYRGQLSDFDRQSVEDYLEQKYLTSSGAGYTYQWKHNGTNITSASGSAGEHSETLSLQSVSIADQGSYSVVVTNIGGMASSSEATLVVIQVPTITVQPVSQEAATNTSVILSALATGSPTLSYQWRRNGINLLNAGNVSGADTASLTLGSVTQGHAGVYSLRVTNFAGSVISSNANVSIIVPPSITVQPTSQVACMGSVVTLTASASGGAVSYHWLKNGSPLSNGITVSGATSSVLQFVGVSQLDASQYSLIASNSAGTAISSAASLTVSNPLIVDLDIDSFNTNGFEVPKRTPAEDAGEASSPGKYVIVNDADTDGDGVPNFADGFDYNGNEGTNASSAFVPLILHLSPADNTLTKIRFTYSASDPKDSVTNGGSGFTYIPAPGHLRLWTKDGPESRSKLDVTATNGSYVASGVEYTLANLGFSKLNPVIKLYIEGIRPSLPAGELISVEVDADGSNQGCLSSDSVRVSVDFDSDGDGLVDRWEERIGTEPQEVDSDGDGRSDFEELADATDPVSDESVKHQRLAHWTFLNNTLLSEEGADPFFHEGTSFTLAKSWDAPAMSLLFPLEQSAETLGLGYPLFRTPTRPNLTLRRGTVSFWFQPNWESDAPNTNGSPVLFNLSQGNQSTNANTDVGAPYWGLQLDQNRTNLSFLTARASGNTNQVQLASTRVAWTNFVDGTNPVSSQWHHVALRYCETSISLFVDGTMAFSTNATELINWPGLLPSTNPWCIWIGGRGTNHLANGSFDEIETFNYELTASEIAIKYQSIAGLDSDMDGLTDLDELRRGLNPRNPDTDGDGMPDGWEVRYHLNPKDGTDSHGNLDTDERDNGNEFLFGTDPQVSDQPFFDSIPYDLASTTNDKALLVNIDFGNPGKSIAQQGPAAAGIDANDQWFVWPLTGVKNALPNAGGTNSEVNMACIYGPILPYYIGCATEAGGGLADPSTGQLCGAFHFLSCNCDNVCNEGLFYFSGGYGTSSGVQFEKSRSETVGKGSSIGEISRFEVDVPVYPSQSWPSTNLCSIILGYDRTVPVLALEAEPIPEFLKEAWAFDVSQPALPSSRSMLQDSTESHLDSISSTVLPNLYLNTTECESGVDMFRARASVRIGGLHGIAYRIYLYGGLEGGAHQKQTITVQNATTIPGSSEKFPITIASGTSSEYVEGVNYTRFVAEPFGDEVTLRWNHRNSSLRGMQILELRPLSDPLVRATNSISGSVIQWKAVPQALEYLVFRKDPGDTAFHNIARTSGCYYQDFSVLPWGNADANTNSRTYIYQVQATNEIFTSSSAPKDVTYFPPYEQPTPGTGVITAANNRPPILNSIDTLRQAYERSPFVFGAPKIQAAAKAFDYEGEPIRFILTRIACGKVTWIDTANASASTEELTNEMLQNELTNGTLTKLRVIGPNIQVRWTPPEGSLGDTVAFKVRAFDGLSASLNAADVVINVKPQTMLLWWGNYGYGMSGGGISSSAPLQFGSQLWPENGSLPPNFLSYDLFSYSKLPAPALVNLESVSKPSESEYQPVVDGTLRNVIALDGQWNEDGFGPVGNRIALTCDGTVWTWGINRFGQNGDGRITSPEPANLQMLPWFASREQPYVTKVDGISNVVSIAGNGDYCLAVKSDGSVWGWGGSVAKLFDQGATYFSPNIKTVSTVPFYAHPFDRSNLALYSSVTYDRKDWEAKIAGNTNNHTSVVGAIRSPIHIPGLTNIVKVVAGNFYCLALSADGRVFFWGALDWHVNSLIMDGDSVEIKELKGPGERIVDIGDGDLAALYVLTDTGKIHYWSNINGDWTFVPTPFVSNVKQMSTRRGNVLAILNDGTVFQRGYVGISGNGAGLVGPSIYLDTGMKVEGLKDITAVSAGWLSSYAIDNKGRLWGWGIENYGLFGHTYQQSWDQRYISDPVLLGGLNNVEFVRTLDMNAYATATVRDVPQNLLAKPADEAVSLSWDTFPFTSQYEIKRATTEDGPYNWVATVQGKEGFERQELVDRGLVNYTTYFYRVAVNVNGQDRSSDPVKVIPQPLPSTPAAPTVAPMSRQLRVKWSADTRVDSYRVWRSVSGPTGAFVAIATMMNQVRSVREMFVQDRFLSPGATNWYKIQAINAAGESGLSEAAFGIANDKGPVPPSDLTTTTNNRSIGLTWSVPAGLQGQGSFAVWKATATCNSSNSDSTLHWNLVGISYTNQFEVTGLINNRCYAFAVSTLDDRGESARCDFRVARPGTAVGLPTLLLLEQAVGPGSIYLKWRCEVPSFLVSAVNTNTNTNPGASILCGPLPTPVFPDDNGTAEIWVTDLAPGDYRFRIFRVGDESADIDGFPCTVQVTNAAPSRSSGSYPLRPLVAVPASNRVDLSWWGSTDAGAGSLVQQFANWRFMVLRQESGVLTDGFPCNNFERVVNGFGFIYSDTNVVNGHTYRYQLIGISPTLEVFQRELGDDTEGGSHSIIPASFFGNGSSISLAAVSLNSAVQLSWQSNSWSFPVTSNSKVELFYSRGSSEPYVFLSNVTTNHVYLHNDLSNGQTYYYKVRATYSNGEFLEGTAVANPSSDKPLLPPRNFAGTVGAGRLLIHWQPVSGATAYKVQKWNTTNGQYEAFSTVALPELVVPLGGSTAVYRYKVFAIAGGRDGLSTEIRVEPFTWTWPANLPSATRFDIQRQCGGSDWITIGSTSFLQFTDVRTTCVSEAASYRAVPVIDGNQDLAHAQTSTQTQTGDTQLTAPPAFVNAFQNGTNSTDDGEVIIRLLDFDSATNSESALGFNTPTNIMLRASVSFSPRLKGVTLGRVEFYAGGELLTSASQLPFEHTWKNPAGTIDGRLYALTVRVVDSLGRSLDSPVYYATVTNQPPLKAFTTGVGDLQIAAPGVPLSLSRSYNSQDLRAGSLGKGWKTAWDQARMIVPNLHEGWYAKRAILSSEPFNIQETNAHRVDVTLPSGGTEHFHLMPMVPNDAARKQLGVAGVDLGWINPSADDFSYHLQFVFAPEADAFGSLAEKQGATVLQVGGDDFTLEGMADTELPVSLSRGDVFVPNSFLYTGSDGSVYEYGQALTIDTNGTQELSLVSVRDRNGNTLTYNASVVSGTTNRSFHGMTHSSGRSLVWTNETISGTEFVCVYDPIAQTNGGPAVIRYRVQDDLLKEVHHLRSRTNASDYEVTKYEYFSGLPDAAASINGMLKRVISSEGTILLENDYFGTASTDPIAYLGFLKSQQDVVGVSASLEHDNNNVTGDISSTVSQSIPGTTSTNSSVVVYDSAGKPTQVTDESGQTNSMGYDERGRLTYTQNAAGDYKGFDYDDKDRPIATIDELGNQTDITYGAFDQPVNTTDAEGNGTHYEYYHYPSEHNLADPNPEGSLKSVQDAAGVLTEYIYDNRGQVLTETRRVPGISAPFTTTYAYETSGDLKATKEPLWPGGSSKLYTTEYTYDENGNRKTEERFRQVVKREGGVVADTAALETVTTTYEYDAQNRLLTSVMSVRVGEAASNPLQTTTSHYNHAGKVDYTVDAYGRKTEMLYDVRGNLIETKYVDDAVTRTVYDAKGRSIWQQERCLPAGNSTTAPATFTEYDQAGRVVAVKRYPNVTLTKVSATPVNESGVITNSSAQYRVLSGANAPAQYTMTTNAVAADSFVSISRTVYDNLGRVHYSMDTRGVVTAYTYDAVGRRTMVSVYAGKPIALTDEITVSGRHIDTSFGYDANGNQVWVKDALGNQTDFEYDSMNRRTITRFPAVDGDSNLRRFRKTSYDALGRRTREMDEAGVMTAFGYDALGRLTSVTNDFKIEYASNEEPVVTRYEYDAFGNEITQTDAMSRTTRYEYDALGRRTHRILPGGDANETDENAYLERATYSQVALSGGISVMQKQVKDFRGRITQFDYDRLDRLVKVTPAAVDLQTHAIAPEERTSVEYSYTGSGQPARVVQMVGTERTVNYAYDTLGRLRVKQAPEGTLTYDYDVVGSLSKISARYSYNWNTNAPYSFEALTTNAVDSSRAEWNYRYDPLGRLESVNPDSTATNAPADARYTYTEVGNLKTTAYRNSLVTTYNYNQRNWLRNLETKNGAGVRMAFFDYDNPTWPTLNRLSPTGQRRSVQETYGSEARTVTYAYDRLSRLTAENIVPGSTGPKGVVRYDRVDPSSTTQGYDLVGNRRSRQLIDENGLATAGVTNATTTYDSHDLITGGAYSYDPAGNTTKDTANAAYVYDAENRLIQRSGGSLPTVTIVYDADGNRVGKSVVVGTETNTTLYLVDDRNPTGYAQVMEESAKTNSGSLNLIRTYVYGLDLISQTQSGNVTYYGYDGLGSTRYLSDSSTNVTDSYTYDAFGIQIDKSGSTLNNFRYTGEQWDADLGMYYLRARYYKPELGRFWTMDSFEGGQEEIANLHRYLYAENTPVNGIDPSGHMTMASFTVTMGTWGTMIGYMTYRAAPALNRATIILYEATTGNTVIFGAGGGTVALKATTKIGGVSWLTWQWIGNILKGQGKQVGTYKELAKVIEKTGAQANHLNQAKAFPKIAYEEGVSVAMGGGTNVKGSQHWKFHDVLEAFWNAARRVGKKTVTNAEYGSAMREGLEASGFQPEEVKALVKVAEESRITFGYHDNGGFQPTVPNAIPGM